MRNVSVAWLMASGCMFATPVKKCEELAALPFGADVTIESAKTVSALSNLPEHCDVRGVIWPEARFAIKLRSEFCAGVQSHERTLVECCGTRGRIKTA
jgi:hypothetical protein